MSSDIRAALERLVSAYKECSEHYEEIWPQYLDGPMAAARAALAAAPEGEPSDDQLDLVVIAIQALTPHQPDATTHDLHAVDRGREILRQSLARWGRPAAPPAPVEGEPSDEEWDALVERAWDKYETVGYQGERFMYSGDFGSALDLVRKELARWGRSATPPAPLEGSDA